MLTLRKTPISIAFLLWIVLLFPAITAAQIGSDLHIESELVEETGPFGLVQFLIRGTLSNRSEHAYKNLKVSARVSNETGNTLEEGEGYLIRACGSALYDYTLLPGAEVQFAVPLELRNSNEVDQHKIIISGDKIHLKEAEFTSAFRQVVGGEVVVLEWLSPAILQFATGCATAPLTALQWHQFHVGSSSRSPIEHPLSANIDETFRIASLIDRITQSGERDVNLYDHSLLRSHHQANRVVFQNDLGHLMTAELNGSYPRLVDESSFRNSLQGVEWLGPGRFLAYTYGTYGDEVRYLTAQVDGRRLSSQIADSLPSQTKPGASSDGALLALGLADRDPPGYYLKLTVGTTLELLYATALPGNNAPAPILYRADNQRWAYLVTPAESEASWQLVCVNRDTGVSRSLSNLPIHLPADQRAWFALSPDGSILALSADGGQGGLWLMALPPVPC